LADLDGAWYKRRLSEVGKTQRDMAKYLGYDKTTVYMLIAGKRKIRLDDVKPLAKFLNSSPLEVLARSGYDMTDKVRGAEISEVSPDGREEETAVWKIPKTALQDRMGANPAHVRILDVVGNEMASEIKDGSFVIVDTSKTVPSPAGIFAINDGFSFVVRKITPELYSDPPTIEISTKAEPDKSTRIEAKKVKILGRVVGVIQKM